MSAPPCRKIRLLLIAEACNPTWSSVPLVGYNVAHALAEKPELEITLATHIRNREGLAGNVLESATHLVFVDNEAIAKPLYNFAKLLRGGKTLSWTTGTAMAWPSYMAFERRLFSLLREPLANGNFDLIHRVTPVSPTMGSPLASLVKTTPMLIGPLNGGLPWPKEFAQLRRKEREWLVPLRRLYTRLPYYRSTYSNVAGVIAGSHHVETEIPQYFSGQRFYMPENGIDPKRFPLADCWPEPQGPFRFVTVGRLVPYKGTDMTLEAIAGSDMLRQCKFDVIGDGPERTRLEKQTDELGLRDSVVFHGWLTQTDLAQRMRSAQAFVFPSVREFGGGVVLEAMAAGLPSILVDYGGPAELIDDSCALPLPLNPKPELIPELRLAMESLANNHDRCREMSSAAVERIRTQFLWNVKAESLLSIYKELLGREIETESPLPALVGE